MPKAKRANQGVPYRLCPECGSQNPTGLLQCADCGHEFPEPEHIKHGISASDAPVLSSQIQNKIVTYPVTDVRYSIHKKPGSPDSLRVEYWSGLRNVCSEWVCFESPSAWARGKAQQWWQRRGLPGCPRTTQTVFEQVLEAMQPHTITVNESGKWPNLIAVDFAPLEAAA